jgi:hypothetical protein
MSQRYILRQFAVLLDELGDQLTPLQVFQLCGIEMVDFHYALRQEGVDV